LKVNFAVQAMAFVRSKFPTSSDPLPAAGDP